MARGAGRDDHAWPGRRVRRRHARILGIMPGADPIPIEPARPDDLAGVADLLRRVRLPTDGLAEHRATLLVARDARGIVGSAALEVYQDGALLRSVAVAPEHRGSGLGERLTRAALDLARRRRVADVYLLTETATGFFPRFGFRSIDRATVARGVQRSVEFASVCPVSAQAMVLHLSAGGA